MSPRLIALSFRPRTPVTQPGLLNMTHLPHDARNSNKSVASAGLLSGIRSLLIRPDRGLDDRECRYPQLHLNHHTLSATLGRARRPLRTAFGRTAQTPVPQLTVIPGRATSPSANNKHHRSRDPPCKCHTATQDQFITTRVYSPHPLLTRGQQDLSACREINVGQHPA